MTTPSRPDATEWNATVYHQISNPHMTWGANVLARLDVRGNETVLDAGRGTGRLTAELLERLPAGQVIAADRSRNMLDEARKHLAPRFGDRVRYLQADLQTISLIDVGVPVDLIFSTAALHWVLDHPRLFAALHSILVPGGWLVAQSGGGPNLAALLDRAGVLMTSPPYAPFFAGWPGPWEFADDVTTAARLREAGFVDVETSLEAAPTQLADFAGYRDFLTNVIFGSHLARLPDKESRTAFVGTLSEQAATDDPPFALDYWRLNLKGRRPV